MTETIRPQAWKDPRSGIWHARVDLYDAPAAAALIKRALMARDLVDPAADVIVLDVSEDEASSVYRARDRYLSRGPSGWRRARPYGMFYAGDHVKVTGCEGRRHYFRTGTVIELTYVGDDSMSDRLRYVGRGPGAYGEHAWDVYIDDSQYVSACDFVLTDEPVSTREEVGALPHHFR